MINTGGTPFIQRSRVATLSAGLLAAAVIAGCGSTGAATGTGSGSPRPAVAGTSAVPTGPVPPAFNASGPDEFRLAASHTPSIPFNVQRLRLSNGSIVTAGLGSGSMARSAGQLTEGFRLGYPNGTGMQAASFRLAQGQSRVIGGKYRFQVLRLWDMPDPVNNAADVRITPLG